MESGGRRILHSRLVGLHTEIKSQNPRSQSAKLLGREERPLKSLSPIAKQETPQTPLCVHLDRTWHVEFWERWVLAFVTSVIRTLCWHGVDF